MRDLISIIIPVYNVEKYVAETLESVIGQSYHNTEIIIINDGSVDGSLDICREYGKKDNRIRIINKRNEGLSIAREEGILNAHGVFISMIDSDDVLDLFYIEKMYNKLIQTNADICLCARKTFGINESQVFLLDNKIKKGLRIDKLLVETSYYHLAEMYQMSDSWNKMYRKSFIKDSDVHFYLDKKYNGTDLLFNYLLLLHCPYIVTINEPLYSYRIVQNSRVHRKNKPLQEGFEFIYNELRNEAEKIGYSKKAFVQIDTIYVSMIKYVTQDIFEEAKSKTEINTRIKNCITTCKKFHGPNYWNIMSNLSSIKMKVFFFLLNKAILRGICMYYGLRKLRQK